MATEEQAQHSTLFSHLRSGSYVRAGQRLTISDRTVSKLAFYLYKKGSPTGNVTFTIRKVSDDSLINSKVWGDAADIPGSVTLEEVTFVTPELVNEEVRICVEFSGGNIANEIGFYGETSDVKGGEYFEWYTTSWAKPAEWDLAYRYKYYEV
ncbi:hypothetical protein ES703_62183 [subsurface metagenome]